MCARQGDPRDASDEEWDAALNGGHAPDPHMNGEHVMDEDMDPLQIVQDAFHAADEIRLMVVSDADSNTSTNEEASCNSGRESMVEPSNERSEVPGEFNQGNDTEEESAPVNINIDGDDPEHGETSTLYWFLSVVGK